VNNQLDTKAIIDIAIKLTALAIIGAWCFKILSPFMLPIIWAAILAVAIYPLFTKLTNVFGGSEKLAAITIAVIGVGLLVVPTVTFGISSVESVNSLLEQAKAGTLMVPAPNESIKSWPLVGDKLFTAWSQASVDLQEFIIKHADGVKSFVTNVFGALAGVGATVLQFVISIIIACVLLVNTKACSLGCAQLINRLMGLKHGPQALKTSVQTVRSVAVGVLGVAAIQALLSGVALVLAGIPAAGVWVLAVLLVAIMQLPPIIVLGPIAAYYFSVADTTPAVLFLVWSIAVSVSDAVLKPMFLGRGMDVPMLVILLGAIGGMIVSGILGLFTGAIILALGYQLLVDWLSHTKQDLANTDAEGEA